MMIVEAGAGGLAPTIATTTTAVGDRLTRPLIEIPPELRRGDGTVHPAPFIDSEGNIDPVIATNPLPYSFSAPCDVKDVNATSTFLTYTRNSRQVEEGVEKRLGEGPLLQAAPLASSSTPTLVREPNCELKTCRACEQPIREKYLHQVLECNYHEDCLRCADCRQLLTKTCFSRQGSVYCREHFLKRFGPKCSRCGETIGERSIVRRAQEHVYHLECFRCAICKRELSTGDQFYLIPMDGRLVCRQDFEASSKEGEMDGGNKRPRTTISAKSLETLKQAYQTSNKPARHVREQLALQTGLDMRVVQVWFQNRRAKEKRLKKDAGRRWNTNRGAGGQGAEHGTSGSHKSGRRDRSAAATASTPHGENTNPAASASTSHYVVQQRRDASEPGSQEHSMDDQLSMEETGPHSSPMYGSSAAAGVYGMEQNSSDLDMHSELNYDPNQSYLVAQQSLATGVHQQQQQQQEGVSATSQLHHPSLHLPIHSSPLTQLDPLVHSGSASSIALHHHGQPSLMPSNLHPPESIGAISYVEIGGPHSAVSGPLPTASFGGAQQGGVAANSSQHLITHPHGPLISLNHHSQPPHQHQFQLGMGELNFMGGRGGPQFHFPAQLAVGSTWSTAAINDVTNHHPPPHLLLLPTTTSVPQGVENHIGAMSFVNPNG